MGPIGRSREGAWIEMDMKPEMWTQIIRRSREGAWIEMELSKEVKSRK